MHSSQTFHGLFNIFVLEKLPLPNSETMFTRDTEETLGNPIVSVKIAAEGVGRAVVQSLKPGHGIIVSDITGNGIMVSACLNNV